MAFQLFVATDAPPIDFGDRASYSFNTHGLLVIVADNGARMTYSPNGWLRIEDPAKGSGR